MKLSKYAQSRKHKKERKFDRKEKKGTSPRGTSLEAEDSGKYCPLPQETLTRGLLRTTQIIFHSDSRKKSPNFLSSDILNNVKHLEKLEQRDWSFKPQLRYLFSEGSGKLTQF